MISTQVNKPIYNSLKLRNFIIAMLRLIVPLFGLVILGFLLLQIIISNMTGNYNISGIRVKSDKIIIDAPQYSGVMANGTKYEVSSERATTALKGGDEIELFDVVLDLVRLDNSKMQATSEEATINLVDQIVDVEGLMNVITSTGLKAELTNSIIVFEKQILESKDKVIIRFSDGSVLNSKSLFYDGKAEKWDFNEVTLLIPIKETGQ